MKIFTSEDFDSLWMNTRTVQLSKQYQQKGAVQLLHIEEVEQYYGIEYHINAIVEVSNHMNECSIIINEGQIVESHKCDCPWGHFDICAHIGAVLYMLTLIDVDTFPYHFQKTTKALQDYIIKKQEQRDKIEQLRKRLVMESKFKDSNNLIYQFQSNYKNKLESLLDDNAYTLTPNFDFDFEGILIDFQISATDKKYVIKNFRDFLSRLDRKVYYSYGKFLTVVHDKDRFDKLSLKWIELMKLERYSKDVYQDYSYYLRRYDHNRYISVDKTNISYFYDMFKDEKINGLEFKNEVFKYRIRIEDNQDYYEISQLEDLNYIKGDDAFYKIEDGLIIRYEVENTYGLEHLMNLLKRDSVFIDKDQFDNFNHYVLSSIEKYLDIEWSLIDDKKLSSVLTGCKVYGDLFDEKTVVFHAIGYQGDTEIEIIHNDGVVHGFQTDLIKTVLEDNADYIDDEHRAYFNLDKESTYELINEKTAQLSKYLDVFVSDELKRLGKKTHYNLTVGVTIQNNLLEVNLESSDFDVNEVDAILRAYHKKKRYFKLKSGLMIHLESDELEELDSMMNAYNLKAKDFQNGKIKLDNYRALSLDKTLDELEYIQVDKGQDLSQYINGFENMISDIKIKSDYDSVLRPYQKKGTEWLLTLYKYNLNGILADEMGLGKTIQVIAMLDSIMSDDKTSIVVCPASLIYNWQDEISKFSKALKSISVTGSKAERSKKITDYKNYDLLITSYDYLRRDIDLYDEHVFEYVILDEAQYIKNQKTKNANAVKSLNAKHRLALSGTPIENSLAELWSIFDFLMPGYLYTYHYFKGEYETPIVLHSNDKVQKRLKSMVSPFILRRIKEDVLKDLPSKVDHKYLLEFNTNEKKLYMANLATVNKEMQANMKEANFDRIKILSMLTKLRQLCLDPRLVYDNIDHPSSKILATVDLIKVMVENNKKILLFSAFTSLLDLISEELRKEDISYYMLTGSTNKEERRKLVNEFNQNDTSVFLISLKAGGTGLNLTSAEVVIHIDPWWNISAQNQATDRAHRIGQNANVQVYRMIMKDSIEEKILLMQERKANLAASFVEGNDGSLSKMSKEDIISLFER